MDQLDSNRKNVEAELKEVRRLCRWERPDNYLAIENSKRTRQKVKKLIQKFTDTLRLPVMLVRPDIAKERVQFLPLLGPAILNGASDMRVEVLVSALGAEQLNDRVSWYAVWRDKLKETVGSFHQEMHLKTLLMGEEHVYQGDWEILWNTVANIGKEIAGCSYLWKGSIDVAKKMSLSRLLNLLKDSGLQKHKFENVEMSNHFKGLLYQPAYDPKHLVHPSKVVEDQNKENSMVEWRVANEFYFKSLASVQIMLNIDRKHSDVKAEEVKQAISFLNHLVEIQRQQRKTAYGFAELLNRFRQHVLSLSKLLEDSTDVDRKDDSVFGFPQNQRAIFDCLWQQKQLFDNITSKLLEESALLRTIGSTHLDSCQAVKASSRSVLSLIEKLIPIAQNSKASLDSLLLGSNGSIITQSSCVNQFVTQHMVQLLRQNFDQLMELENQISTFCKDNEKSYARDVLFSHFSTVFKEGKLLAEKLNSLLNVGDQSTGMAPKEQFILEENLASTFANVKEVIEKLCSYKDGNVSEKEKGNINIWDGLFKKAESDLNIDNLCKLLSETFGSIEKLLNSSGVLSACVGDKLKQLQSFLDLLLCFGDSYLKEFLAISKTVSLITHVLASVLADLFTKGFGITKKEEDDDSNVEKTENVNGKGLGDDDVGRAKDISDQIEDEDQLLGTDKKEEEEKEQDTPDENNKGIEMSDDLDVKEQSISEDSQEDNDDEKETENDELDKKMGETGDDAEKADEKPLNEDEDEEAGDMNEKNESGPSVEDKDTSSRELRAKDDGVDPADKPEESDKPESNASDKPEDGKDENVDEDGDTEDLIDKIQSKEEELADPPGQTPDDMEIDETDEVENKDADHQEETCSEDENPADEVENDQEPQKPADETMEAEDEDGPSPQEDDSGNDLEEKSERESIEGKEAMSEGMKQDLNDNITGGESGSQNPQGSNVLGAGSTAPQENLSANVCNELTASADLPSDSNTEMNPMVTTLSSGETLTDTTQNMESAENRSSTAEQTKVNPYRNVGDALKEWKERVKVSSDLAEKQEAENEVVEEDPDAGEYGFASQLDPGTSQALGPALPEQVNPNMREEEETEEEKLAGNQNDEVAPMDIDDMNPEIKPAVQSKPKPSVSNSVSDQVQEPGTDMTHQENSPTQNFGDGNDRMDSRVSVDDTFAGEAPDWMQLTDKDSDNIEENDEEDPDAKTNAVNLWRICENLTAKPSQELAEQLRLILEPTLASKLSGDYRTGKRINMKKVIPYIASHYRKDKIWLRRTKPNKRDYQVVIAVDDSRSMSESGCGDFAIRALATVCRAMTQLEMGSLAVASFGRKGSIKMLHDFDQSFTTESGIKMISGLTFKQENLIEDEPVVNLLRNMNEMLDNLASTRRQSSGSNPLQQLVLIIGDGKFHEREKLKRSVRNFLHKKRMVVYLLLDDAQQSVLDLLDFVHIGGKNGLQKMNYLDSFPFPYYILLRDIEALPRTLGDVLRQWFELMQNSRD